MNRCLQSALEKRTRVGTWQTRVYLLERGYLSTWPDVTSAAAKEEPSGTECLFQGKEVAILTDQGDRRFKLEFPWDKSSNLSLRASDVVMKKSWVDILGATLKEAASQIQGTGSVFAYGGLTQHHADESYEEATYLKTNRFLAAYVVDASSRASYINDCLNEHFQHGSVAEGGEGTVAGICAGANAVIDEHMTLMQDFKEEMLGLKDLRQERQGSGLGVVSPATAAPKIHRFCEDYLTLWGRSMTSRLMLELAPFMDPAVTETRTAPPEPTRAQLASTRGKLDEMYVAAEQILVSGSRLWLFDIRGDLLDCEGILNASNVHQTSTETHETNPLPESSPSAAASSGMTHVMDALQSSSKSQLTSTISVPRIVPALSNSNAQSQQSPEGRIAESGLGGVTASLSSQLSGFFRRASRTEQNQSGVPPPKESSGPSPYSGGGNDPQERITPPGDRKEGSKFALSDQDIGDTKVELFAGARSSAQSLPCLSPRAKVGGEPSGAAPAGAGGESERPGSPTVPTSPSRQSGTVRRGRRAFAGGLWNRGGSEGGASTKEASGARPTVKSVPTPGQAQDMSAPVVEASTGVEKAPSGSGRRRFAGGAMGTEARVPIVTREDSNPCGGGGDGHREVTLAMSNSPPPAVAGGSRFLSTPVSPLRQAQDAGSPGFGTQAGGDKSPSGRGNRRFAGRGMGMEVRAPMASHEKSNPFGGDGGDGRESGLESRDISSPRPKPSSWEASEVAGENQSPAWASGDGAVPDWALGGGAGTVSATESSLKVGLAPSSKPDAKSDEIARKSPLVRPEKEIPVSQPRQLRRPGGGTRRAFGGGQSVF